MNPHLTFLYVVGTHQEVYANLLYRGMGGAKDELVSDDSGSSVVTWGWRLGERLHNKGKNVLVMERGYLGDRQEWTSLGWNGLNGYANFYNDDVSDDRWVKYWKDGMKPWRGDVGDYVLVCGQVPTDMSLSDCQSYEAFIAVKISELKQKYGHRVMFRHHPMTLGKRMVRLPRGVDEVDSLRTTLEDNIKDARLVVAWNSNSAIEAMYNGVPYEVSSPGSLVYDYQPIDFNEPDRNDLGRKLAYCQWNKTELANGTAWQHIQRGL